MPEPHTRGAPCYGRGTRQRHVLEGRRMQRDEAVKRCRERALPQWPCRRSATSQARVHVDPVGRGLPGGETAAVPRASMNRATVRTAGRVAMSETPLEYHFQGVDPGAWSDGPGAAPGRRTLVRQTRPATRFASRRDVQPERQPCARRGAARAPQYCHRERRQQRRPAVQVGLSCALAGLPPADCRRSTATRQLSSVAKKVPGETRPAEQNGHARDAGCSPRSHPQQRVSQPSRVGEIADFDQHPYAVCGHREHAAGLPLETLRRAELELSRSGALRPRASPGRLERSGQCAMGCGLVGKGVGERGRHLHQDAAVSSDRGEMRWRLDTFPPAPATAQASVRTLTYPPPARGKRT